MKKVQINGFEFLCEIQNNAIGEFLMKMDYKTLSPYEQIAYKSTVLRTAMCKIYYSLN